MARIAKDLLEAPAFYLKKARDYTLAEAVYTVEKKLS